MRLQRNLLILPIILCFAVCNLFAQPVQNLSSSELHLAIKKLNKLASVLYIAAHPDDENTSILSYYSSHELFRTAYLSVTRGDGGQNLIGSEQAELLGIIRTQELLEARKIDGAEQFFTRAIDFGYSKSPGETFKIWNRDSVLADVVWVIRKFRPDVIITRFPVTGEGTHGHHTASAILAAEASELAGNPDAFTWQLRYVKPWKPVRVYWNAWLPLLQQQNADLSLLISVDTGTYNTLLGKSYSEIAALSRSMHKSQGFGASARRGEYLNYFSIISGSPAKENLFDDIETSWKRVSGSEKVDSLLLFADRNFNHNNPALSIPVLLEAYNELLKLDDDYWKPLKLRELTTVIKGCAGIWIEAIAQDYSAVPGEELTVTTGVVNRSDYPFSLESTRLTYGTEVIKNIRLENGKFEETKVTVRIPDNAGYTQPYWLKAQSETGRFGISDITLTGMPENHPPLIAEFIISSPQGKIVLTTPVLYTWTDPVDGEKYRPFEIVPPVTINIEEKIYLFPDNQPVNINITLKNNRVMTSGLLSLNLPEGWKSEPDQTEFSLSGKHSEKIFSFKVTPPSNPAETLLQTVVTVNGIQLNQGMVTISYPHIMTQTVFPPAESKLIRLDVKKKISEIGYIMGSGDEIPKYLSQLGYKITELNDAMLTNTDFSSFDAIITGIRAYNTRERLGVINKKLLDYVYAGGTLVVQYNVSRGLHTENIGPYEFTISRDRVTEEDSEVRFLKPEHQLLNYPNKITKKDFAGWIQERGLYYAGKWSEKYETVISLNDTGESPKEGGLIFARYGNGVFIYTGDSYFRQLPAGVSGAYRLFVNLISSGKINSQAH